MSAEVAETMQTILFADVVDSTGLYTTFGDDQAQIILQKCMDLMEEIAGTHSGVVRKRIGDEVLCVFESASNAAAAASQMHARIGAGFAEGVFPRAMRVRIGFEHGPVIEEDGELFGNTVHTAARLSARSKAGQTLTTKETVEKLDVITRAAQRFYGRVQLKGHTEERDLHELITGSSATIMSTRIPPEMLRGGLGYLELRYGDEVVRVDAMHPRLDLGRDDACGLRVEGQAVSRLHARITFERGRAQIEDISSNGSGVRPEDGPARDLLHDSAVLKGKGTLRLGLNCPEEAVAVVHYACLDG